MIRLVINQLTKVTDLHIFGFFVIVFLLYAFKSYAYEKIFNNLGVTEYLGWLPIYRWMILCSYLAPGSGLGVYKMLPIWSWFVLPIPIAGQLIPAYMRGTIMLYAHNEVLHKTSISKPIIFLFGLLPFTWFVVALFKYKKLPID